MAKVKAATRFAASALADLLRMARVTAGVPEPHPACVESLTYQLQGVMIEVRMAEHVSIDILPVAALVCDSLPSDFAPLAAVKFRVGDRTVEARPSRSSGEWEFTLRRRGRGRTPGPHPDLLASHYRAVMSQLQALRLCMKGKHAPTELFQKSSWLAKLVLHWTPLPPLVSLPKWLRPIGEAVLKAHYKYHPAEPPTLLVPLAYLPWIAEEASEKPARIRVTGASQGPEIGFELSPLENLTWNELVDGQFVPSDVACELVGIYHSQLVGKNPSMRKPLAAGYVKRVVRSVGRRSSSE